MWFEMQVEQQVQQLTGLQQTRDKLQLQYSEDEGNLADGKCTNKLHSSHAIEMKVRHIATTPSTLTCTAHYTPLHMPSSS